MAHDNNPFDLNSAAEREEHYEKITRNPDQGVYSPNDIHISLVNSGNDPALQDAAEYASRNGGTASQHNNTTARLADKMMRGLAKSTADPFKSEDSSAGERIMNGVEHAVLHDKNPGLLHPGEDMNNYPPSSDTGQVIQAVYGFLMFAGLPEGQLRVGMVAEAKNGDLEMAGHANMLEDNASLESLYEMADDPEMQQYIQEAHANHIQNMDEAGIKDLPQLVGAEPELDEQTPTVDNELVLAQQLDQDVSLGGPTAMAMDSPTAPT